MRKLKKDKLYTFLTSLSAIIFMWIAWFVAYKCVKNEYLLPSFSETMKSFFEILTEKFFYKSLIKTVYRVLLSFSISLVLGGTLAIIGKIFYRFSQFVKPFMSIIRTLPTMAILVIILIYAGVSTAPIIVAILVLLPMIYKQFTTALEQIDQGLTWAMQVYNISKKDRIKKIYAPIITPSIARNIGSNLSFAIKLVISAEVMSYTFISIGGMMQVSNALMEIPRLMALTLISVVLGLIVEFVFYLIFKKAFKWQKGEQVDDRN